MGGESRGTIALSTARPPLPHDIFACPIPPWSGGGDETHLTDGVSHNYNCRQIPPAALKTLLKRPKLVAEAGATEADVDAGGLCGFVFVSERDDGLETLHVSLRFDDAVGRSKTKVFSMAEIFGAADFSGVRMEDSGCFAGGYTVGSGSNRTVVDHCIVYVSTKEPAEERRSPWTAVYKTSLPTGKTERLTPQGVSDLSPAVSPSGRMIAVASFQSKKWCGEIENLKTDIYVMNVDDGEGSGPRGMGRVRKLLVTDGGWPSWGSDDVIFFHRGMDEHLVCRNWGVFQYRISTDQIVRVTPENIDAMTPAAISETKVAVATIRQKLGWTMHNCVPNQYRHIEIIDVAAHDEPCRVPPLQVTILNRGLDDHFNPFVLDGGSRVGYHRCRTDRLLHFEDHGTLLRSNFGKLQAPESHKDVDLIRMLGVYPTISKDGSMLAFVDGERKAVWLADENGLRVIYEKRHAYSLFSVSWNQNPNKDTLYVCVGPAFCYSKPVEIHAILNASKPRPQRRVQRLTSGGFNNAFPSSSPDGSRLVFRSTRYAGDKQGAAGKLLLPHHRQEEYDEDKKHKKKHKNLYIMEDAETGEFGDSDVTRLTNGPWTDTHCQWSPNGNWIVFASTRDKPMNAPEFDVLDEGCYAVFLVKAADPTVVIRVIKSRDDLRGHVQYPVFSADGRSIAVSADLAAVSAEPISLPPMLGAVRPYQDIFVVDIDTEDLEKNKDVKGFHRITHSRYQCSTSAWAPIGATTAHWNMLLRDDGQQEMSTRRCCGRHG